LGSNIYVGDIFRNATEADLKETFDAHGAAQRASPSSKIS
jgi:hypothetical protein